MLSSIKRFLSRFPTLQAAVGDVLFETAPIRGRTSVGELSLRIKKDARGQHYIGVKMRPDYGYGGEGSQTGFINFDIQSAQRLKLDLEETLQRLAELATQEAPHAAKEAAASYPGPWSAPKT